MTVLCILYIMTKCHNT